jgi:MFS family permease
VTRITPARPPLRIRIAGVFAEPVLRALTIATLVSAVGRGVSLTLVVLYLTLIVGLPAAQVALVFTIGAAVGIGASYLGGHLADVISARRMLVVVTVVTGVALASLVFVTEFWGALAVEVVVSIALSANGSVRSAIIARAFTGPARVTSRAVLRTVMNIGIAAGSGIAAIPLAIGTPMAYQAVLVVGGAAYATSALLLTSLPARVDAPVRTAGEDAAPRGRSPWRDPRYLLFSAFSAVLAMLFSLANIGVPLWLAHDTVAPEYLLSIMLIVNTTLVILLQVPMSRGTHDLRRAGNVTAIAGVLLAIACVLYGAAGGVGLLAAVVLLLAATVLHAFAEILSQAGAWGLSFELADPDRAGAYQGVYSMGFSIGSMVAPLVITATALDNGLIGWIVLGGIFLASAVGVTAIAYRAARTTEPAPAA